MNQSDDTQASLQARRRLSERLGRALDLPMAAASLLFLGLFVTSLTLPDNSPQQEWVESTITIIWFLFVLEFTTRFAVAPERGAFLRRNWFDLLAVALPALRWLRVLRVFRVLQGSGRLFASASGMRLLSLSRAGLVARRGLGGVWQFLRVSRFALVLAVTVLVVALAAVIVLGLERSAPETNILTLGDALWWGAALVTTVASDKNPVTGAGRAVAVFVMVYGMAVFGYFMSCAVVFIQGHRADSASSDKGETTECFRGHQGEDDT